MRTFSSSIAARSDITLAGNFRSSKHVVTLAERLCPTHPAMEAVGPNQDYEFEPIYRNVPTLESAILDYFLPVVREEEIPLGNTAILAPNWYTLYPLGKRLRREGVPIFGPGARPYKRRLVFAPFAEEVCAYLESRRTTSIRGVQRSLFHMIEDLTGRSEWTVFSYEGRVLISRFLREAEVLRQRGLSAEDWLRYAVDILERILAPQGLLSEENIEVTRDSAEQMIAGLQNDAELVSPIGIEHLGLFAAPRDSISLMTIHHSKGREFDAVAIVDLHDGKIPHWSATEDQIEEARSVLYVGITRARKILMLFTDMSRDRNRPSRLLGSGGVGMIN